MAKEILSKSTLGTIFTTTNNVRNYQRYIAFKEIFNEKFDNLYRIFAEPQILAQDNLGRPTQISWRTDWEMATPPKKFTDFSATEQEVMRGKIKAQIDVLLGFARKSEKIDASYRDMQNILISSLEIPDESSIYVFKDSKENKERYVITEWGFLKDELNPQVGVIRRWKALHNSIFVFARYPDESPAKQATFHFEYGDTSFSHKTNEAGRLEIEDIPVMASLSYYQINEENEVINQGIIHTNENQKDYIVYIPKPIRYTNATITVKDTQGNLLPNYTLCIERENSALQNSVSDANAKVYLTKIAENELLTVSFVQNSEKKFAQTYTTNLENPHYTFIINLLPPFAENIIFEFINSKKEKLPNVEVVFKANQEKKVFYTNQEGKIIVPQLPFQLISLKAAKENLVYSGDLEIKHNVSFYQIELKKKKPILWWLLGLLGLLLLGLFIWWWFSGPIIMHCGETASHENSKNKHEDIRIWKMETNGKFDISCKFGDYEDEITVYDGDNDKEKVLFSGKVKGMDTLENLTSSHSSKRIMVRIKGFSASNNEWYYTVSCPQKVITLSFNVVDTTGSPIVDANVELSMDKGKTALQKSDANGKVTFQVPEGAIVSVLAEKTGYSSNIDIQNQKAEDLAKKTDKERNVILRVPEKPVLPCSEPASSGGSITDIRTWSMGKRAGTFGFEYNCATIPDEIIIYSGDDDTTPFIWSTGGAVSGHQLIPAIPFNSKTGNITVKVIGSTDIGTSWKYQIICPE